MAASAELGTGLVGAGWRGAGAALLAASAVLWCVLMPAARDTVRRWPEGSVFMVTVATEALAVLAATLAAAEGAQWLAYGALAPLLLGLLLYPLVLARFDLRELRRGRGDQWVAGGALAISALAAAEAERALAATGTSAPLLQVPRTVALCLWVAAIAWLPLLAAAELLPLRLRYDLRRWSTVFPLGMYAACSFAVASAAGASAPHDFARVWVWVTFAAWLATAAATLSRLRRSV